ncbi:cell wall metabolism sensor histidine kinase WalK [Variovorax sp. OV329]|uniref:sensor histidine kinase n=1 Tax=Variovorax sp. OV329 TaxID=1882825 RepID=UPI0008E21A8D|nr:ATP-binding protein [Variovorax sp. OV329]SFN28385.1 two-component system, OmpR family, sensor kinase/two-component system, OmpR family, sensor histidine kinase QseC [Variovorax sp. OV329]
MTPTRPHSLRRQLWWWLVGLYLAATALTALFSYQAFGRLINTFMDEQMRIVADSYAGGVQSRTLQPLASEKALRAGAFVVQIWSADGAMLLASSWPALGLPLQTQAGFDTVEWEADGDDRWRVYTVLPDPQSPAADRPRVQVVQSASFRQQRATRRAWLESLPIVLLLPVSLLVLWLIVAAGSRSLRQVAREVAAQDERNPAELPVARVPEEIGPLVLAFNSLLARLRNALATQRRFVQDAAHELRTPITAIGLQVENLRGLIPPGEAAERFEQLEAGVTRARHLSEQLLRLSRQDVPAAADSADADLAAVLRESVGQLMPLADRRRIDVGFEGKGAPRVAVPAAELRSIFDNLIDNAIRYAPEGSAVDVRLQGGAAGGPVVVEVLDSGPGIPPEFIGRVFDRFFRVPGAPAGGSGLGLAIAQGVGRRHGLRIELRNREDTRGLLARVTLGPVPGSA